MLNGKEQEKAIEDFSAMLSVLKIIVSSKCIKGKVELSIGDEGA